MLTLRRMPVPDRATWIAVALVAATAALGGCLSHPTRPIEIAFAARTASGPFSCRREVGSGADAAGPVASDLRLYVHGFELLDARARAVPVALDADDAWQDGSVALLDFEDGSGACANGTAGTHTVVSGRVPEGDYRGLRFVVGVPFAANHANPATASPPLSLGQMSWGWQAGHKFLRFEDLGADGRPVRLHLGSTGCEGAIGRVERCLRPNRVAVALPDFAPALDRVEIDLAALFDGAATSAAADGARGCMSDPHDPSCAPPFAALGLGIDSGLAAGAQRVFHARRG